jgi:pyrroloquinoline quinone (PQQ) biosynthesis protein C
MDERQWREQLSGIVRDGILGGPGFQRFFAARLNPKRAKISLTQIGIFIKHRRECWAWVSGNCPEMMVKQKILAHEYDEVIEDQYSKYGHLQLVVRQGESLGMTAEEVLGARPLPTTRATLYSWGWITLRRPWLEGLGALMATEWGNDDRLFKDAGGGVSRREAISWMEDLGMKREQIPHLEAHSEADEEHGDMFLPVLAEFGGGHEERILSAARESMELYDLFRLGLALAMEAV